MGSILQAEELSITVVPTAANFGAYEIRKDLANSDYDGKIFMPAEEVQSITLDSLELENCVLIKLDILPLSKMG